MASIKPTVRSKKKEGLVPLQLLVVGDDSSVAYMRTHIMIKPGVYDKKTGRIKDRQLSLQVDALIYKYFEKLNAQPRYRTAKEIISTLLGESALPTIREFVKTTRYADNPKTQTVLNSFESHLQHPATFDDVTVPILQGWLDELSCRTLTASQVYSSDLRTIVNIARRTYNDPYKGVEVVKPYPSEYLKTAKRQKPNTRALSLEEIRQVFTAGSTSPRENMCMMLCRLSFLLAGINFHDLYEMKKTNLVEGKLHYNRQKTKDSRYDKGYFEITIPREALPIINNLKDDPDSPYLLRLHKINAPYANFSRAASNMTRFAFIKLGLGNITPYVFRRTWASIARNDLEFSMDDVAFCLNHVSAHRITDAYVKPDYSRVDRVNRAVIDYVLYDIRP